MAGFLNKLISSSEEDSEPEGPEHALSMDVGAMCDVGSVRQVNQDRVWAAVGDAAPDGVQGVFVVADGMGGHAAGEVAAQMAVDGVSERMLALSGAQLLSSLETMRTLMASVNIAVHDASFEPGQRGMGSTLTICALSGATLVIGHIGDSRAYVLRQGVLKQITPDHSWVMEMVARGFLTLEEAATHPRRNILTRALGIDRQIDAHVGFYEMFEGDVLILCSDGLHGVVAEANIVDVLTEERAQAACERLVDMANRLGGPDNIGVLVARINRLFAREGAGPSSAIPSAEEGAAATIPPGGI